METRLKRFLSLALAIVMVIGMMPTNIVYATEIEGTQEVVSAETTEPETSEPEETSSETCTHENANTVTVDASCIAEGSVTITCECGYRNVETIAKVEHSYGEGVETTAATCTEAGVKTFTCTVEGCGATKTEEIAVLAHTYTDGVCSCGATETPAETETPTETPTEGEVAVVAEVDPVAKIGEQGYETFDAALTAAAAMSGVVTIEIYGKVTLKQPLNGSYSSIKFVGEDTDAEIYMDIQGYIDAPGKKVAFEGLKLSKVEGGHITNAGFMNLAFGIYSATETTYTNCTFLNGAYASYGKVTFTDCTFYRSHDRYGLWAYGANEVIVDGCTFADIRGIKVYDEGKQQLTGLTVKNTDFSAVTDKPAIVLTSGKSVALEGNTYNPSKGVFELDLDGNPDGTPVTYDVAPTCVNDNGACGVLVDGKIYTTVAQAAKVATSGSTVTLLHNSAETVELAEGVTLEKNGFEAANVTVAAPSEPETPAYVAQIGEQGYESLQAAVDAAVAGATVTIIADIADVAVEVNKNLTIAGSATLKNVSISGGTGCEELTVSGLNFTGNSWINCGSAKKLTVSGVTADVTPSNASATNSRSAFISLGRSEQHELELVVENCNIVSRGGSDPILGWAAITKATLNGNTFGSASAHQSNSDSVKFMSIADGAEFVITNNTVYSDYNGIVFAQNTTRDNDYTVVIDDNTFVGGADHIWIEISGSNTVHAKIEATSDNTVNGNAFTAADIKYRNSISNWDGYAGVDVTKDTDGKLIGGSFMRAPSAEYIASGLEAVQDNNAWVLQEAKVFVAEVNGTQYETLQAAIDAARGQTVKLINNVTFDTVYANNKTNWNGDLNYELNVSGNVTLDLNGYTIKSTGGSSHSYYALICVRSGSLEIVDSSEAKTGAIVTDVSAVGSKVYTIYNNGSLTVSGGTISNYAAGGYAIESVTVKDTALTINKDATITSVSIAVRVCSQGSGGTQTVNINGGAISGSYAMWVPVKNGGSDVINMTISGGTLTGSSNAVLFDTYTNGDATTDSIKISGGKFNGNVLIGAQYSDDANNQALSAALAGKVISGGIFSNDMTQFCEFGYAMEQNQDGTYGVVEAVTSAIEVTYKDGTIAYFDNILDAVPFKINYDKVEGATIKLLKDYTGSGIRFVENDMVLDLNGHTYTINEGTGSNTTRTSAFQIRNTANKVIIKNGTIAIAPAAEMNAEWGKIAWVFNSYTNLDLVNVVVDMTNMTWSYGTNVYAVYSQNETNNIQLTGTTAIVNFDEAVGDASIYAKGAMVIENTVSVDGAIKMATGATLTAPAGLTVTTADGYEVKYENGVYTSVEVKYAAEVNGVKYATIADAIAAAQAGETVVILPGEYGGFNISNKNITIKGSVGENGELLTTIKGGNPAITGHGFNGTIKDIKIVDAFKVMYAEPAGNVTVDNVYVTGATYGLHLVAYSTGLTWTIQNSYMDLSWANSFGVHGGGDAEIIITGNEFASTNPYHPDYGAIVVNSFLPDVTVEENIFGENTKIYIDKSVTDTSEINVSKNYHADGVANAFADDADGVKVPILQYYADVDDNGDLINLVTCVAQVGDQYYATLEEAFKAATSGCEIDILSDVTVDYYWDARNTGAKFNVPVNIDGNDHTIKFTDTVYDAGNHMAAFRFEADATVKNLTVDMSEAVSGFAGRFRAISTQGNLTVDECTFIGNGSANNTRAIIFGETTKVDIAEQKIVITGSTFTGWRRGVSDNESGKTEVANVTLTKNTFEDASTYVSASESVTFTGNTVTSGDVNIKSYSSDNLAVTATCNTLAKGGNYLIADAKTVEAQEEFDIALRGKGTATDPYLISNVKDLIFFRDSVNAGDTTYNAPGVHVALADDIDLAGFDWSVNIGDDCSATFDGIFDGKGHTIKNLTSTETEQKGDGYVCTGLFGAIYGSAVIKNLTIENANINTGNFTGNNAGIVVGFVYAGDGAVIENVKVTGDIQLNAKGVYGVGAIVGYAYYGNSLTIKDCVVAGDADSQITAASAASGIIGYSSNYNLTVDGCSVKSVALNANAIAGGIAGVVTGGTYSNNTVENVTLTVKNENWQNSAAVVVGTLAGAPVTVTNTTISNVNVTDIVGSQYAEHPTTPVAKVAARIGDTYYATLQDAVDAAQAGDEITVLADVTLSAAVTINKSITLDLNGKTIQNSIGYAIVVDGSSTLTLNDTSASKTGTIKGQKGINVLKNSAMIMNNGNIDVESTAIQVYGSNVTVNDGNIASQANAILMYNNNEVYGTFTMNDGELKAPGVAILANGTYDNVTATINGGKITSTSDEAAAIYWPAAGKLTINGGELAGAMAVYVKSGSLEITGGTLTGNGIKKDYAFMNSGCVTTGDALVIENVGGNTGYEAIESVTISGGNFISENAASVASYAHPDATAVTGFISGGTYNNRPAAELIADGYEVLESNGTYTVVKKAVVNGEARIGDTLYATLADAIAAANAAATAQNINIMKSIAVKPNAEITAPVNIVTNGYTLWNSTGAAALAEIVDTNRFDITDVMSLGMIFAITAQPQAAEPVAKIGVTTYATVEAALRDAQPGDTVVMIANSDESGVYLNVTEGITLDLNGFTLKARSLAGFQKTNVYDSADSRGKNVLGKLVLPKGNLTLDENNFELPFWDDINNCYVFLAPNTGTAYQFFSGTKNENEFTMEFRPGFGYIDGNNVKNLYMQNGAIDNEVTFKVRASWIGADGETVISQTYTYTDEMAAKVYNAGTFTIRMVGLSSITRMDMNVIVTTNSGVSYVGETLTYTK